MNVAFLSTTFQSIPAQYQGSHEPEEPLDLLYAIATAKRVANCVYVDVNDDGLATTLEDADAIVISTTNSYLQWNNHPLGLDMLKRIWSRMDAVAPDWSSRRRVIFGPHVPAHADELFEMGADYVLLGEAEMEACLAATEVGRTRYAGCRVDPALGVAAATAAVVDPLDSLPCPAYETTIGRSYWAHNHPEKGRTGHLYEASRGCPYFCSFCNTVTHRRAFRFKSPAKIEADLARLAGLTAKDYVYFIDELFGFRTQWLDDLAPRLEQLPFQYGCQANLRFMSRSKLDAMRQAGFVSIEFGFETADEDLLRLVGKDNRLGTAADLLCYAANIGLNPLLFVLVGLPGERAVTLARTVDFLRTLPPEVRISVGMPTPYIGTKLYAIGVSEGTIPRDAKGEFLYRYTGQIGHGMCFDPEAAKAFMSKYGENHNLTPVFLDQFESDLCELFQIGLATSWQAR